MAMETVPRLPAIRKVHVPNESVESSREPGDTKTSAGDSERKDEDNARQRQATSFMARVRLGSVLKQPRPGDVYRPHTTAELGNFSGAKHQRPLGEFNLGLVHGYWWSTC